MKLVGFACWRFDLCSLAVELSAIAPLVFVLGTYEIESCYLRPPLGGKQPSQGEAIMHHVSDAF